MQNAATGELVFAYSTLTEQFADCGGKDPLRIIIDNNLLIISEPPPASHDSMAASTKMPPFFSSVPLHPTPREKWIDVKTLFGDIFEVFILPEIAR